MSHRICIFTLCRAGRGASATSIQVDGTGTLISPRAEARTELLMRRAESQFPFPRAVEWRSSCSPTRQVVPKWVILRMPGDGLSSYTCTRRSWDTPRRAWVTHPGSDADREQRSAATGRLSHGDEETSLCSPASLEARNRGQGRGARDASHTARCSSGPNFPWWSCRPKKGDTNG